MGYSVGRRTGTHVLQYRDEAGQVIGVFVVDSRGTAFARTHPTRQRQGVYTALLLEAFRLGLSIDFRARSSRRRLARHGSCPCNIRTERRRLPGVRGSTTFRGHSGDSRGCHACGARNSLTTELVRTHEGPRTGGPYESNAMTNVVTCGGAVLTRHDVPNGRSENT